MDNGYAICLKEWILDREIKSELPLLLLISNLCAKIGYCYANNRYFADILNEHEKVISRKIQKLINKGYVSAEYKKRGSEITNRVLRVAKKLPDRQLKSYPSSNEKVTQNIISNNIINNNIKLHSPQSKIYAERLSEIVRKNRKINIDNRKISQWAKSIDLLINKDGVAEERIEQAIAWYSENVGGDFVPVIESGTTFREKFGKLESAIERAKQNRKSSIFDEEPKTEHDWSWV